MKIAGRALLVTATLAAFAGEAAAAPRRPIRFDRLSIEQGLSQSTVMDVLQDRRGYIWIATEDGLNRYDGVAFEVFRHDAADPSSLPSSFVWDVVEDGDGDLWIATTAGLARWHRATGRITRQPAVGARHLRALALSAADDALWIGTRDAGLLRLDLRTATLQSFVHDDFDAASLADDRVYALHVEEGGHLWVGTSRGLDRLAAGETRFHHFGLAAADPGGAGHGGVRAIAGDPSGLLWVGTAAAGLHRLDPGTGGVERFRHDPALPASLSADHVRAILHDTDGRMWVGTTAGLDLFDPVRGTFAHYRHDTRHPWSLADDAVLSLAQDRGGVLWVGTRLGGVHKWNPLAWQFGHVAPEPASAAGLGSGRVTAFSEDRGGRVWVGTADAGLFVMERGTRNISAYERPARAGTLPSRRVTALHHDGAGDLWIGTADAGLVGRRAATGAFTTYRPDPARPAAGPSALHVTAILEDAGGELWLGTTEGLDRFDPARGRFTSFRQDPKDPSSLGGSHVTGLAEAMDGRLWIATAESGLSLFDPGTGRFQHFRHRGGDPASLPSDAVQAVFVDAAGTLWVGTRGGLARREPDARAFETLTARDGLAGDVVQGIRADRQGQVWVATNRGLSRLDPETKAFVSYGPGDGLQDSEFHPGAAYQSASGELFFGGRNGFNLFRPERLRTAPAPGVVLTAVTVDRRRMDGPADQLRGIRLGHREKVLGLEFAALDFTDPDRNRYSYRLEGFDADWVPLAGGHDVTYTNLAPGHYTFRLRGANKDGRWSEEALSLAVDVVAPPWATPWAFTGYSVFLMGAMFGMARIQQRRLDREAEYARLLEFRVHERTRELTARQGDLERANGFLARASVTDSLTGLANRRFLAECLEKEVALLQRRYARPGALAAEGLDLAFFMIDLDHFKAVNDSAGHGAGDAVLRQLADVLLSCSRSSDILVRWGGDEFLLVARDLDGGHAELAERIRTRVAEHAFETGDGRVVRTTCSIGVASYPFLREALDALTWEQVVSVADRALYAAKASGRDAWVAFQPASAATPPAGLFGAICNGTEQAVRAGTLRVTTSLPGARQLVCAKPAATVRA